MEVFINFTNIQHYNDILIKLEFLVYMYINYMLDMFPINRNHQSHIECLCHPGP